MIVEKYTGSTAAVFDQAITTSAVSTNVINNKAAGDFFKPLYLHARVTQAFVSTVSTTLQVLMKTSAQESITTATTVMDLLDGAVATASLTLGARWVKPFPVKDMKQYSRMDYTVAATAAFTAGKLSIYISNSPETL